MNFGSAPISDPNGPDRDWPDARQFFHASCRKCGHSFLGAKNRTWCAACESTHLESKATAAKTPQPPPASATLDSAGAECPPVPSGPSAP